MFSKSLLVYTSISQWTLFLGAVCILFGIFEKREWIIMTGKLIFMALGCLALWVLLSDTIQIPEVQRGEKITKEMNVLFFFKSSIILMILTALSLTLKLFKLRFTKASTYLVLIFALMLFFTIFNIQQTPQ